MSKLATTYLFATSSAAVLEFNRFKAKFLILFNSHLSSSQANMKSLETMVKIFIATTSQR